MNDQRYKVVYNEDGDGAQISDEVKEEWLFPEDCADLLNSQYERIAELEKDNLRLKKFSSFQSEVVTNSEVEIAGLEQNLGLIKLGVEQQHKQLISCETALDERNNKVSLQASRIAELEKERDALSKRISCAEQVEKMFAEMPDLTFEQCEKLFPDEFEAHNLEQRAKGIARFTELHLSGHSLFKSLSANYCSVLLIQAKQLREGVIHE